MEWVPSSQDSQQDGEQSSQGSSSQLSQKSNNKNNPEAALTAEEKNEMKESELYTHVNLSNLNHTTK